MNDKATGVVCQNDITRNEIAVLGTYIGINTFPAVIKALESGALKPSALTTHRLPLDRIFEGFVAARAGEAIKVVLTP